MARPATLLGRTLHRTSTGATTERPTVRVPGADARFLRRTVRYWPASRRGTDAVHLVLGTIMVVFGAWVAGSTDPAIIEVNAFRLINELPSAFGPPLLGIMQLGALPAVALFGAIALLGRRPRLARYLVVGGFLAWTVAKILQVVVDQEPPDLVLSNVTLHGSVAPGLAFPATHVAVAAALATIGGPYLSRPNRRLAWWLVAAVGVARVYVGAHLPIDVVGGIGVGWAVGALLHLLLGAPGRLPASQALCRAVNDIRLTSGQQIAVPSGQATGRELRVDGSGGSPPLVLKLVGRDEVGADWLYRAWRLLVFRRDDERQRMRSPRELAEHEAYLLLLAHQAGVRVPQLVGTRAVGEEHAVLVRECIDGVPLAELAGGCASEPALVDAWKQLHRLHDAGITYDRHGLDGFVLDTQNCVWLVDLSSGSTVGAPHRFARDSAELCLTIAERHGVEVASRCARGALEPAQLSEMLSVLQPLELSSRGRRAGRRDHLLSRLRAELAQAAGTEARPPTSPTRVAVRNLVPLLGAMFAVNLLLPQVGQAQATLDALRNAHWLWVLGIAAASAGTYLSAAISLMGAAGRRLELARTTAAQLASAFTNRFAPAGLGGMTTNVLYLRAAGSSRAQAITAVGLNSVGGFIVHLVGVAAIVPLLGAGHTRLHLSGPDLPERFQYLLIAVALLGIVGLVRWWKVVHRKVAPAVRAMFAALLATAGNPRSAVALLTGAAGVTGFYTLALAAACQAFGVGLPLSTVAAVFLGGSAVAAAAPTPGGLGALEAALVAGFTAAGAASGPAIAAVLVYRLVTYWLPVIPGAVAYHVLRRSGSL